MGQNLIFGLVNGTIYNWKKVVDSKAQVSTTFPDNVASGTSPESSLSFEDVSSSKWPNSFAQINYSLEGTPYQLKLEFKYKPEFEIYVTLLGFGTDVCRADEAMRMTWGANMDVDGIARFILSGRDGAFSSSCPTVTAADWMQRNLKTLGPRPLKQLCIPGTHDAGMSSITHPETLPTNWLAAFSLCQDTAIIGQLIYGSRYFDIRPIYGGGQLYAGHYDQGLGFGARGQKLSSIVEDVNKFTSLYKELIILNVSHAYATDSDDYHDLSQEEWMPIFRELSKINDLCMLTKEEVKNMTSLPLSRFIGPDRAAVLVIAEPFNPVTLNEYENKGFYYKKDFEVVNEYSDTDKCDDMAKDQLQKLDKFDFKTSKLFLLSWTLTLQIKSWQQAVLQVHGVLTGMKTNETIANIANRALFRDLLGRCQVGKGPNIIYVDYIFAPGDFAALAMAVNEKCFGS